jgi:hypothetical protein
MAAPAELVQAVKDELRTASPKPPANITNKLDLRIDLRLTDDIVRGLAAPFESIAQGYKPGAHISRDECGDLESVGDAISLVATKAGFGEEG